MTNLIFEIIHPGDEGAGIIGYAERITIETESGDWHGEDGEFEDYIKQVLAEWYDGAKVAIVLLR